VDPGLYGCIAALVWVLQRHHLAVPHHVTKHRRLGPCYRRTLVITRVSVAGLGMAVFSVAVARFVASVLPGMQGAALYLAGVCSALALLLLVETAVLVLRRAIAREAARSAARRERARSVRTMMRLGLGPRSEQLF